jgi:hypothetical protein
LRHRNVLNSDRTDGATINGYHHPLASPPKQMSITARGITAKEKKKKIEHHRSWHQRQGDMTICLLKKNMYRVTIGKKKIKNSNKRIVC